MCVVVCLGGRNGHGMWCCDDHALNTHIRHMFCQHVLFIAADREIITVEFIRNGGYVFLVYSRRWWHSFWGDAIEMVYSLTTVQ